MSVDLVIRSLLDDALGGIALPYLCDLCARSRQSILGTACAGLRKQALFLLALTSSDIGNGAEGGKSAVMSDRDVILNALPRLPFRGDGLAGGSDRMDRAAWTVTWRR